MRGAELSNCVSLKLYLGRSDVELAMCAIGEISQFRAGRSRRGCLNRSRLLQGWHAMRHLD